MRLTITVIGALLGIPFLILGVWLRPRTARNLKMAKETLEEYAQSMGVSRSVAA